MAVARRAPRAIGLRLLTEQAREIRSARFDRFRLGGDGPRRVDRRLRANWNGGCPKQEDDAKWQDESEEPNRERSAGHALILGHWPVETAVVPAVAETQRVMRFEEVNGSIRWTEQTGRPVHGRA